MSLSLPGTERFSRRRCRPFHRWIWAGIQSLLSGADRALGRLDGSVLTLSNPDLFVLMYVRKEAVVLERLRQLSPRQRGQIVSRFLRAITA